MFLIPNLKGIAMLGVLLAHSSIYCELMRAYIELFAMPIFAFFIGYALKKSNDIDLVYIRRILIIYFFANLSYFILKLPLNFNDIKLGTELILKLYCERFSSKSRIIT